MKMKGQGALEYLMTYGWALLVIVVVGAALYALGVLNPATYAQSRCTGFQYFQFESQQMTAANGYSLDVRNGVQEVTVKGIKVGTMTSSATPTVTVDGAATTSAVSRGKKMTISTSTDATDKATGDTFSDYTVQITYDVSGGAAGYNDTATCTGKVQ